MFTGIIETAGTVESLERSGEGGRLRVRVPPELAATLQVSASIAVNGCCLTVTEMREGIFSADLSGETLRRTAFGEIKPGRRVNLERPLRAGAELGGHFVQGHVDGVGRVARLVPEGSAANPKAWVYSVRVPAELARYVAMKGSIALDGISLTVAGWRDGIVEAAIIPYTFEHTNLRDITIGDAVNIECDVLAKYLERLMAARGEAPASKLTVEKLIEQGF
ncbi:MAG: riboflavin synthase [Candidatus Acidiferrales bacterium]